MKFKALSVAAPTVFKEREVLTNARPRNSAKKKLGRRAHS